MVAQPTWPGKAASAGNRPRVTSMAPMDSATRPLMPVCTALGSCSGQALPYCPRRRSPLEGPLRGGRRPGRPLGPAAAAGVKRREKEEPMPAAGSGPASSPIRGWRSPCDIWPLDIHGRRGLCEVAVLGLWDLRGTSAWARRANPATRNRTRDHLIAANVYSQMLCQLSYSQSCCARGASQAPHYY